MKRLFLLLVLLLPLLLLSSGCTMWGPRHVAVMNFENATGEARYDFLSTAVPEYLTNGLTNYKGIQLRERQSIQRFLTEVEADRPDLESKRLSMWQKLGQRLEADFLIAGSVSRLNGNFILIARLFSVATGEVIPGSAVQRSCTNEIEIYNQSRTIAATLAGLIVYNDESLRAEIRQSRARSVSPAPADTLPISN